MPPRDFPNVPAQEPRLAALAATRRSNAILCSQSSNRGSLMPVAVNKSDAVDAALEGDIDGAGALIFQRPVPEG